MKLKDATVPSHAPNAIRVDLGGDMTLYLAPAKVAQARLARSEIVDLDDVIHAQGGSVYRAIFLVAVVGAPPDRTQPVQPIGAALIWRYRTQSYYTPTLADWSHDFFDAWPGLHGEIPLTTGGQNAD